MKVYIGGLDQDEISNGMLNFNTFYSNNLQLTKYQLNYFDLLSIENNNFDKKFSLFDYSLLNSTCTKQNSVYCGQNIWSSNCYLGKKIRI